MMQDPIGLFLRIRDFYQSYLDTAFRIADLSVAGERRKLLGTPGALCTEPLVEPLPRYRQHRRELHDLVRADPDADPLAGFTETERRVFIEVVLAGLFRSHESTNGPTLREADFKPYSHQLEMLAKGVAPGTPGVVTSGTGSGKTESFLLPVIARIIKEACSWPRQSETYLKPRWWQREDATPPEYASAKHPLRNPWRPKRSGEAQGRPAAVRALILYPMNALVEDQMVRLRRSLDSREAREVMNEFLGGNRIFFGRYTGATVTTGPRNDAQGLAYLHALSKGERAATGAARDVGFDELERKLERDWQRRKRSQEEMAKTMLALEKTQARARTKADAEAPLDAAPRAFAEADRRKPFEPFMFPSVDGAEMATRWDMQEHPPDILITNMSMLSAMLTREVDRDVFVRTREWLESDPDAYFFLVMDELHLQRGSAGTEVSHLLKLLFVALGLDRPGHRHKLRVLASSASLPVGSSEEARESASYLWDMFGSFGLGRETPQKQGRERWQEAIVPGSEVEPADPVEVGRVSPEPFLALLRYEEGRSRSDPDSSTSPVVFCSDPDASEETQRLWTSVAKELGVVADDLPTAVGKAIERAALFLERACRENDEDGGKRRARATKVSVVAERLFENMAGVEYEASLDAVRALLFVRGAGDGLDAYFDRHQGAAPNSNVASFRVHTFFRAIEGVFAPAGRRLYAPVPGEPKRQAEVGPLSIEREARKPAGGDAQAHRLFELLYCEACGELFFGGMRPEYDRPPSGVLDELLPHEPALEGLPDRAASSRFEELTYEQYAIFWPSTATPVLVEEANRADLGRWIEARLDPITGTVYESANLFHRYSGPRNEERQITGRLYRRQPSKPSRSRKRRPDEDRHERDGAHAETHVPYACPKCGTDYYWRSSGKGRLSPIRNFRAGFGKTTQLLATELFDAQRTATRGTSEKIVAFSDSRQDAARASLEIQRLHHQDLRRELLVLGAEASAARSRGPEAIRHELGKAIAARREAEDSGDYEREDKLTALIKRLRAEEAGALEPALPLAALFGDRSTLSDMDQEPPPLVADLVTRGVHPFDDVGVARVEGRDIDTGAKEKFSWDQLFEEREGTLFWRDERPNSARHDARTVFMASFLGRNTDVLFNKSYFALEETGLGYATVPLARLPEKRRSEQRVRELSAVVRLLADVYRYRPNPYLDEKSDLKDWRELDACSARVQRFATSVWGDAAEAEWANIVADLDAVGHKSGIVEVDKLYVRLARPNDPFWRCTVCARVHLHAGVGVCTRCRNRLPEEVAPEDIAARLWPDNFLARRVRRARGAGDPRKADTAFRLHCEELTGQTTNPAERQRRFLGVFFDDEDGENPARDEIDLLAVTTTMEVGIDIGPLQSVLQANMPPQRFNYQQRVGRAGRRGQAFSMALTICRSKSHDLYYFATPESITGDPPPIPFLTKRMRTIAQRLLDKKWLIDAFGELRREDRAALRVFPGDLMSPTDIHGEFATVAEANDPSGRLLGRLKTALDRTKLEAQAFAETLSSGAPEEAHPHVDAGALLASVERCAKTFPNKGVGLGQSLAEMGVLPMYGMPTRTRNLYTDIRWRVDGYDMESIDRDLEVAIYEFAPGRKVVKDKFEHLSVGFTPELYVPPSRNELVKATPFQESAFGESFRLVRCPVCSAWQKLEKPEDEIGECPACSALLDNQAPVECLVPNAFRTDLWPSPERDEEPGGVRHQSVQAEGKAIVLEEADYRSVSLRAFFDGSARTYRLNRGPASPGKNRGFVLEQGTQELRKRKKRFELPSQAVDKRYEDLIELRPTPVRQSSSWQGNPVWLAAPKTTDALFLSPSRPNPKLALQRLPSRNEDTASEEAFRWQGVRAAALSATYLIVFRAAKDLDVDPEELEVLEPRRINNAPTLQITDKLLNGAGFCRHLWSEDGGARRITRIIHSMLYDQNAYPIKSMAIGQHASCDQACYKCLLRYGNQAYHGLLDWQLGMTYLRAMTDPHFACGLDGRYATAFGLDGWPALARRLADEGSHRFGTGAAVRAFEGGVFAFELDLVQHPWVVVVHPFWEYEHAEALGCNLEKAYTALTREGRAVEFWDSFNMQRRMVQLRERSRNRLERRST